MTAAVASKLARRAHGPTSVARRSAAAFQPGHDLRMGVVPRPCRHPVIALPLMLAVAMIIYADRKIWAAMALRRGPNVVGPFGLLQSFADGLKVFLKETIIPSAPTRACS